MGSVVQVDQERPSRSVMDEAIATLAFGGVLVMPTDSVYGIGCAATPENPAHERIFAIKQRDRAQTLPWLVADASDLATYGADVPDYAVKLAMRYWPGALTLVVRASDRVPAEYRAADGTIALRCPDSNLVRASAQGGTPGNDQRKHAWRGGGHQRRGVEPRIVERRTSRWMRVPRRWPWPPPSWAVRSPVVIIARVPSQLPRSMRRPPSLRPKAGHRGRFAPCPKVGHQGRFSLSDCRRSVMCRPAPFLLGARPALPSAMSHGWTKGTALSSQLDIGDGSPCPKVGQRGRFSLSGSRSPQVRHPGWCLLRVGQRGWRSWLPAVCLPAARLTFIGGFRAVRYWSTNNQSYRRIQCTDNSFFVEVLLRFANNESQRCRKRTKCK